MRHALKKTDDQIRDAIDNKNFCMAYMPIVDGETGKPEFYEVLARMGTAEGEAVSNDDLIPEIERQGLAADFDKYMFNLVISKLEETPGLCLSVNISALTASQADWADYIRAALNKARGDSVKRLIIEITETAVITDEPNVFRLIGTLCEAGAQVALDDFGAGSTSLRYLHKLNLSIVKMDKSMLESFLTDPKQRFVMKSLVELMHGLDIKVVAEGVESEAMAAALRDININYMQGYHFGQPRLEICPIP